VAPTGSTRFSVWLGDDPVIVADAELPLDTLPIDKLFAGPAGPVAPTLPCGPWLPVAPTGRTRFSVCVGAVPVMVAAAVPLVIVPIARLFAGPAGPVGPVAPGAADGDTVTPIVSPLVAVTFGPDCPLTVTVILTESSL
jgi:hypothetical protein